jgi:hypothetical protein
MCFILNQVHACGHTKPVCITACPHAIATSYPNPFLDHEPPSPMTCPISPISDGSTTPLTRASNSHQAHLYTALPSYSPETMYCPYFFPHNLPISKFPCVACYRLAEWEQLRNRWINEYRITHPGTKPEDLERLSGVGILPNTLGLINVETLTRGSKGGGNPRDDRQR